MEESRQSISDKGSTSEDMEDSKDIGALKEELKNEIKAELLTEFKKYLSLGVACLVVWSAVLVSWLLVFSKVQENRIIKSIQEDINNTCTEISTERHYETPYEKPVIYVYPDEDGKEVKVSLTSDYDITCQYPKMENGVWEVVANKDGKIYDKMGLDYNYLYWEGQGDIEFDFSTGFCVKGEDSAKFLEEKLAELGLSRTETNEFIVYWLPKLEANKYNLISFQTDRYTDAYKLNVEPAPDNVLRVFMAFKGLDEPVYIVQQDLESIRGSFVREGFYVVEWGGSDCGL